MSKIKLAMLTAFTLSMTVNQLAYANYQEAITETFNSGAVFSGVASFDDTFLPISVSGTLTGYQAGVDGFVGNSASESISWVFDTTFNYASLPIVSNWWLDVSPADAQSGSVNNSILFSIDFSNPLAPVFTTTDNGINTISSNADFLVSASINAIPEPATLALIGLGVLGMSSRKPGLKSSQKAVLV